MDKEEDAHHPPCSNIVWGSPSQGRYRNPATTRGLGSAEPVREITRQIHGQTAAQSLSTTLIVTNKLKHLSPRQ